MLLRCRSIIPKSVILLSVFNSFSAELWFKDTWTPVWKGQWQLRVSRIKKKPSRDHFLTTCFMYGIFQNFCSDLVKHTQPIFQRCVLSRNVHNALHAVWSHFPKKKRCYEISDGSRHSFQQCWKFFFVFEKMWYILLVWGYSPRRVALEYAQNIPATGNQACCNTLKCYVRLTPDSQHPTTRSNDLSNMFRWTFRFNRAQENTANLTLNLHCYSWWKSIPC